MLRLMLTVLILFAAGCGKSFQEADAIYKDEVAKLEALKEASQRRALSASFEAQDRIEAQAKADGLDPLNDSKVGRAKRVAGDKAAEAIHKKDAPVIQAQEQRVEHAYREKEAAK